MWGHIYVESNDAILFYVISVCSAMHHMDVLDVIVSCMIPRVNIVFPMC